MNERIKELADQCWNNFNLFGVEVKTPDAFAEKFAELIVRECANLVVDDDNAFDILKHFGVEE